MIRTLLCVLALVLALPAASPAQETPFAPVAVVNGDPITRFDVDQRARLLVSMAARARSISSSTALPRASKSA